MEHRHQTSGRTAGRTKVGKGATRGCWAPTGEASSDAYAPPMNRADSDSTQVITDTRSGL